MGSAIFTGRDDTTLGTWIGVYGQDGYEIAATVSMTDAMYLRTMTRTQGTLSQFSANSSNLKHLQKPTEIGSNRVSGAWLHSTKTVHVSESPAGIHQLALYFQDGGLDGRAGTVTVYDHDTDQVQSEHVLTVSDFVDGVWLVWTIRGNIRIEVTRTAGPSAGFAGWFIRDLATVALRNVTGAVRQTGGAILCFLGPPRKSVVWMLLHGSGTLTPFTTYTDDQGRCSARFDAGGFVEEVIIGVAWVP